MEFKGLDRNQLKAMERVQQREIAREFVNNALVPMLASPVFQLLATFIAVEYLQKRTFDWGENHIQKYRYDAILGDMAGNALEAGAVTVATIQALSPYLTRVMENSKDGSAGGSLVSAVVPLIAAAI